MKLGAGPLLLQGVHLELRDRGRLAQPTVFLGQNQLLFQQKFRV